MRIPSDLVVSEGADFVNVMIVAIVRFLEISLDGFCVSAGLLCRRICVFLGVTLHCTAEVCWRFCDPDFRVCRADWPCTGMVFGRFQESYFGYILFPLVLF